MALLHATPITVFMLALFYHWFGIADRYAVFLYNHTIHGPSGPFDEVTVGRYWMSGLVASGIVKVLYIAANWGLARLWLDYRAPAWWRVWLACAVPLGVGIPFITMNVNSPTMPASIAASILIATVSGLMMALVPGAFAAHKPQELVWTAVYGLGLVPPLLLIRAVELPSRGITISVFLANAFEIGSIIFGVLWLGAMGIARARFRQPAPSARAIFLAALGWSYLFLPLVHHLFSTPTQYRYITTASNFFALDLGLQLLTFLIVAGLVIGAARLSQVKLFAFPL